MTNSQLTIEAIFALLSTGFAIHFSHQFGLATAETTRSFNELIGCFKVEKQGLVVTLLLIMVGGILAARCLVPGTQDISLAILLTVLILTACIVSLTYGAWKVHYR